MTPNQGLIERLLLAMTVYMEARGEPYEGKIAVAHAVLNRVKARNKSILDIIFAPLQFSCWNTESPTRMDLDEISDFNKEWRESWVAAIGAVDGALPDPIRGRTLYMNEELVREWNHGTLPGWWERAGAHDLGLKIGQHTFRHDI